MILVASASIALFSCNKESIDTKVEENLTTLGGPPYNAPPGYNWSLHYSYNDFNFHRPRFNCEHGFWFCFIDGYWHWEITPSWPVSTISGTTAHIWGKYLGNNKFEIHFPIALKTQVGYSSNELLNFSVDDTMYLENNTILKFGDYNTNETTTEIIAVVDILSL